MVIICHNGTFRQTNNPVISMKTFLLITALFGVLNILCATTLVTFTGHSSINSQYLSFGDGLVLTDKPVFQTDLTANFSNGAYLLLWASSSFDGSYGKRNGALDFGDEVDVGIGWAGKAYGLDIDVGVTYFDEPTSGKIGANDVVYSHIKVGRAFEHGYNLSVMWENYHSLPGSPKDLLGGNICSTEVSKTTKLFGKLSGVTSIGTSYGDGGFGTNAGFFVKGSAMLSYQLNSAVSLDGGCRFYLPLVSDVRRNNGVWWLGLGYKF